MVLTVELSGTELRADLSKGTPIGISVKPTDTVSAWGLANATYTAYEDNGFLGDVSRGGPCNVEQITFVPHTNGTHTECFGHVTKEKHSVLSYIKDDFYLAKLLTLKSNEDNYLDFSIVDFPSLSVFQALIVRSEPNGVDKKSLNYQGTNPPCISPQDMDKIRKTGIDHLVIDLPSVDPESDGGALLAHHAFWQVDAGKRKQCSITEFVYVPNFISDGDYILKLNIAPFTSDASPSSPIIYPIIST